MLVAKFLKGLLGFHYLRRSAVILSIIALLGSGVPMLSAQSADSPPRKILTGWIPYYSMDTALPSAVTNGDLIREVMPFWYTLKSESKVTDLYTPANPSVPIATPLAAMRDAGFTIIPTITDGTAKSVLASLLAKPATRTQVVSTITNLVINNNFDGIDLDFEGFAFVDGNATWNSTRPNWVSFIQELSASLHGLGKILSVTTPVLFDPASGKKGYYVFDWAAISTSIDRLRIMTYDYSTLNPGPIGPLTWIEQTLQYAVSVVPASKIYVGVAGYGRDWVTKVSGICPTQYLKSVAVGAKAATFVMSKAATLATSYGATPTYNEIFGEENFSYQKVYSGLTDAGLATTCTANRTAWYQDARSYGARADLVSKYHLGGIAAWTLGMEDPSAMVTVRQVAQSIAPDLVLATIAIDQGGSAESAVPYGTEVEITGSFTLSDGQPVAGLAVRLEEQVPGDDNWRQIAELTSGADGGVKTSLIVGRSASLRFSSDATWERTAAQSAAQPLFSSRLISVAAPTLARMGEEFAISGVVQPHVAGLNLTLEKFAAGRWSTIGSGATTDDSGHFNFVISEPISKITRYRVSLSGDDLFAPSATAIFAILVL